MNQMIAFSVCIFREAHTVVRQIKHANLLRSPFPLQQCQQTAFKTHMI